MSSSRPTVLLSAIAAACLALASMLGAPVSAVAGEVYRCSGTNGQLAFTNNPAGYSGCRKVASYADAPADRKAAAGTGPKRTSYRSTPVANTAAAAEASDPGRAEPASADKGDGDVAVHRGAVYRIARANGVTEYTNIRPNGGRYKLLFTYISTCYACNLHSTVNWASTALNLEAYRREVAAAATEYGVDPALLRAVIHAESAFNPNAISNKGAEGLMQLIPGTASDLGVSNPFDVSQNIRGGAQYLATLLKQFNGDTRLATAAYNAGPQNVVKYNGVPPFDETRVYVDRVATLQKRYHAAE
jgi:soluble lytic murein transglycosylase-like protein